MSDRFDLIIESIKKAGAYLKNFKDDNSIIEGKEKAPRDFVTEADCKSQEILIESVKNAFPNDKIIAEEGVMGELSEGRVWLIDPLDGTHNFLHHLPIYCISVGLIENKVGLWGAVYAPELDEFFLAEKGKGATLNGNPIRVSEKSNMPFLATGFPFRAQQDIELYISGFKRILGWGQGVRRMGSAAIDLCYTACGRFDGFWEFSLSPWDVAAGSLMVIESGGIVTDMENGDTFIKTGNIVAGGKSIHPVLLRMVMEEDND